MGIADFFRPKYRHSDVRVRTEAVKALTADDATTLIQIAKTDRDIGVRRIAIEKIDEASVLAELASAESERSLRAFAGERAAQLWQSDACSDDEDEADTALGGIIKLGDQDSLVEVIVQAALPGVRKRAFGELRDPRALAALAKSDAAQELRIGAVGRIDDGDVLRALAIDTTLKEVGLAAVERIDDVDRLENVAQKAKNKAVRQKARKIVSEIQEAERAKKPGTPDDVKRKRAERVQLLREVEAVAETFDFAKASEIVKKAEAAWAALGSNEDAGDDRFAKTVERFWRRKQIHAEQARSADELRAIEKDAQAERERAAAERAARASEGKDGKDGNDEGAEPAKRERKPEADDYVREIAPDPKREARDAEAKQRREERDRQRAEDDARREAQSAERAARQKEDAERGVAIAASLNAMLADMEQLAAQDVKDQKAIDRLLSQSGKAFDAIGKVAAGERDALAERYREVRGKLVTRAGELREAEDWARWQNVPKAEALIATAREMFAEPEATPDLANRLRGLQALWKEVGPMPQRRSKELWETFKSACDQVYEKVKGVRAVEQEKFVEVTKVKEALIAEAEALAESTDWATTADKLKGLQAQWKQSGHLPRKQGDDLWKRFRAACDKFFERRKPMLDARHDEEAANLQKKQALIARAQTLADKAPGEGGWGKAIGGIKDLQTEWKTIGYVPRRDADAVYKAFRAACDSLFAKRDASRDQEANAHRAELDAVRAEIEAAKSTGDVAAAIAVRAKAAELEALTDEVDAMVKHLLENHADAVKGTELDPTKLRAAREKLIARVEELLPKQAAAPEASSSPDLAAQLKAAMRQNAFGDLRFSGRDPIEVLEDLKHEWNAVGPILADEDHAQAERFEAAIGRVLVANGRQPRSAGEGDAQGRRRRRDRHPGAAPVAIHDPVTTAPMPTVAPAPGEAPAPKPIVQRATAAVPVATPSSVETAPMPTVAPAAVPVATPGPSTAPLFTTPVAAATPVIAPTGAPSATPVISKTIPTSAETAPLPAIVRPPAEITPPAPITGGESVPVVAPVLESVPVPAAVFDTVTEPAHVPALRPARASTPPVGGTEMPPLGARTEPLPPPPQRAKPLSTAPPMEEVDSGWDLGDDDPTGGKVEEAAPAPPSSLEMASDGATEGDGLDTVD